ncbi:MAG: methyltransferase domain-containing protein [Rhodanobacteraceae bacterium]|jgi:2-polyprenyl-3-methyl-5-hydroxy-6-metoxy-1,4-benzoquinol methylase|nr:methyltransferase domain-containing protein [Rhodanobacteraceae bacterium]
MDTDGHRAIHGRITAHLQRGHRDYARGKLRFDPAYAEVARLLGDSDTDLLDIGCGIGLLGFYLRECGFRGAYRGVDVDAAKIAAARAAACHYADLCFEAVDASVLPTFRGHVALLDVLHYLHHADQARLLHAAAARVAPGALLIVRNVLRDRSWRFRATVVEEKILYATRWMCSPARHFPCREEVEAPLRAAGLDVETRPLWGVTPFNSFVIVARRSR